MSYEYGKYEEAVRMLSETQTAEKDTRDNAREVDHFLNNKNGQWELSIFNQLDGRPRYTFDKCNPVVDQICGEMEQSDFDISVKMSGGQASKEVAKTYDGLIRNIENISSAKDKVYFPAGRKMVASGLAGWEVVQEYAESDSFEQDLLIKHIHNYVDSVFWDTNAVEQDMSDAEYCFVLSSLSKDRYEKEYPKGSGMSISDGRITEVHYFKKDEVVIARMLYKKYKTKNLILMSNGKVYDADSAEFLQVKDELAALGVAEKETRSRKIPEVYSRVMDGKGWITKEEKTVFNDIPVVPVYGNFTISENKVIYWGSINKLMDSQRVYNYAKSRQVEEGALSPREKIMATPDQVGPHKTTFESMNTNSDPVQLYTHVEGQAPPYKINGPSVNQSLQLTSQDAEDDINKAAGMFNANMGDNPGLQSGVAIQKQQDKGDNGTYKYFSALKIAINRTGIIIKNAIPKVYNNGRQVRLLGQDGSEEFKTLNEVIVDEQTGQPVEINNLSQGNYDVVTTIGPAFYNRQQETASTLIEMMQVDPSIGQIGGDILLQNIQTPGIDLIAERKRLMMINQGLIPDSQMTDEEKQMIEQRKQEAANQPPPPPNPMEQAMIAQAQAETQKAAAETQRVTNQAADILSRIEERSAKIQLQAAKLEGDAEKQQQSFMIAMKNFELQQQKQMSDQFGKMDAVIKTQAETLKILREAYGIDSIVAPEAVETFKQQVETIDNSQEVANQ